MSIKDISDIHRPSPRREIRDEGQKVRFKNTLPYWVLARDIQARDREQIPTESPPLNIESQ